ncbi:FMN reductase (NADH) RutF [Acidocella aquatica]|uniref:FMN reductase (NADH) RutF n=2 Tax=Acidocella aquatica TaxID=1922313 RepID=A0ABQ6A790_9PROT|nr:flavin reductase [Acidocella aquatica]GLR66063.1 FMN reductase (NADH) RutF [Acidocella aquatica]
MLGHTHFREAMARLGAAVNIITTRGQAGDAGMTVSAVCSVTDDPATLIVCINRSSRQHVVFKNAGIICINVLAPEQEELSGIFAGKDNLPMQERFARASWYVLATGALALEHAAASLDCKVAQAVDVGTHTVFFCEVEAIELGVINAGLVYHGRAYHHITHAGA